ncbi:hypothetical protein PBT90_02970 [Algoriphagus halophytocola]|uniref:Uncharacterized protein n=1 Tax=Algoriphagus halophytocola TaxID=2991499 RepID=A0ABY6MF06_9BACT|nr:MULTISPECIES: hypothetical protein [unclassified Algoriphagus]UZD22392.1 hypothetical protein OM944_17250 [Algoriphagus sp. TR-M5]WBL43651.1 hypothetical protein PBT90_02970 [Algoriphagus sp. TR-M9]
MKTKLLPLLVVLIFFASCKDVEEISPNLRLQGFYEQTLQATSQTGEVQYDLINHFIFNADGTFSREDVTLNRGGDVVLGFRASYQGNYQVKDQVATLTYTDPLMMNVADIYYVGKEDLTIMEGTFTTEFYVSDDYSELSYKCPDNARCAQPIPFVRIVE